MFIITYRPGVTLLSDDDVPQLFTCTVIEAPSPDQALLVCQQIGKLHLLHLVIMCVNIFTAEGFQKSTWFVPSS